MPTQLALRFDDVPITCSTQERYHAIAPVLAGISTPNDQAKKLQIGYSTVTRWIRAFREHGMHGLFPESKCARDPYTPERIIVQLVYYKCCAPKAGDRELVRVIYNLTGYKLHHNTVNSICERFYLWKHPQFQNIYPVPFVSHLLRLEMVKLSKQGWSEIRIADILQTSRKTVRKWLRRAQQQSPPLNTNQLRLIDLSKAPHNPQRKVYFGTIHAVLTLQKKYGYAGAFRIQGYLKKDYGIRLSMATVQKIMALNRRVHLAPQRSVAIIEEREIRESPKKSQKPFERIFVDFRYLDAKPEGVQLYSTLLLEGFSRLILAGSLTTEQDAGVLLHVYFQGLLKWGLWNEVISDHGGQFQDKDLDTHE